MPAPVLPNQQPAQRVLDLGARLTTGALTGLAEFPTGTYSLLSQLPEAVAGRSLPGVETARRATKSIDDYIRGITEVPPPETTGERAQEIAGGMLMPGGTLSRGPRMLREAYNVLGPWLPLRQSKTLAGMAAEFGIPFFMQEGLAAHAGEQSIFNPQTPPQEIPGVVSFNGSAGSQPFQPTTTPPVAGQPEDTGIVSFNPPGQTQLPPGVVSFSTPTPDAAPTDQMGLEDRLIYGGLGLLGFAGFGGMAMSVRRAVRANKLIKEVRARTEYGNKQTLMPANVDTKDPGWAETSTLEGPITGGLGQKIYTQSVDNLAALDEALKISVRDGRTSQAEADELMARMRTTTHRAITAMTEDFYNTGRFPGSTLKVKPLRDIEAEAEQLPVDKKAAFESIRTLGTKIDTLQRTWASGTAAGVSLRRLIRKTSWGSEPLANLQAKLALLKRAHPDVVRISDDMQQAYNAVPHFLHESGVISRDMRDAWLRDNPNYHPLAREEQLRTMTRLQRLIGQDSLAPAGNKGFGIDMQWLMERLDPLKTSQRAKALRPEEVGSAIKITPQYFAEIIRYGTINKLRLDIAKVLTRTSVEYDGARVPLGKLTKVNPNPHPDAASVKIYDNGKLRHFTSVDPGILSAMRWSPISVWPYVQPTTQLATKFWTGPYNPAFWLFTNPAYDATAAAFNRPTGMAMGPVTRMLNHIPLLSKMLQSPLGQIIEGPLTAPISVAEASLGIPKYVWGSMLDNASRMAASYGAKHPGSINAQALTEVLRRAYDRTSMALLQRAGGMGAGRFGTVDYGVATKALDAIPLYSERMSWKGFNTRRMLLRRTYMGAYEAVKGMTKLQFFGANVKRELRWQPVTVQLGTGTRVINVPGWEPAVDDLRKLSAQSADLLGDPDRIGGVATTRWGRTQQNVMSGVPYVNAGIQAVSSMARAFKDHPVRFLSTASAFAFASQQVWSSIASTDKGRELINQMTPEQRARGFPLLDEEGNVFGYLPIFPELRLLNTLVTEGTLASLGAITGTEYEGPKDMADAFWRTSATDFLPDFVGNPTINLILAMMGKDVKGPNQLDVIDPERGTYDQAMDGQETSKMAERLKLMGEAIMGTSLNFFITPIMDVLEAERLNRGLQPGEEQIPLDRTLINSLKYHTRDLKAMKMGGFLMDVENKASIANTTWQKLQSSNVVIDEVLRVGQRGLIGAGQTFSSTGPASGVTDQLNLMNNLRDNPEFGIVFAYTKAMEGTLGKMRTQYTAIRRMQDTMERNNTAIPAKDKMTTFNRYQKEKWQLNRDMQELIRSTEQGVSEKLGKPFSYEDYSVPSLELE